MVYLVQEAKKYEKIIFTAHSAQSSCLLDN